MAGALLPKYYVLQQNLIKSIERGEFEPGKPIISERELVEKYQVSRITVRKAIDELVNEGFLYRIQGKGTFIREESGSQNLFSLNSCTEDVRKLGKIPSKKTVFSIKVAADEKRSRELNVTKGDLLYSFGRITYADDEPINYTINYIPEKLFPGLDVYDLEQNSLYKILESHYDVQINRGKRTVEAVIAGPEIAGYLGINPDMPVILFVATITGTINGKEKPIEYFRCYYRTDHYKFYIEQVK
jgi:GntR family transcriptional regulator